MTDKAAWETETGRVWAENYRRTDRSFAGLTDRLLGAASARRINRALDIGCGAGELSLALARGHPHASFHGIDVSADLVAVARERGAHLGNAAFETADAASWSRDSFRPDLLASRHGVMFFDDPGQAFSHLHSVAAEGARLVFSCFRSPGENAWASDIVRMVSVDQPRAPAAGHYAPGPFAFADSSYVEALLRQAGWSDCRFEPVDFAFVLGAGDSAVEEAMEHLARIGPAATLAASLGEPEKADFRARLRRYLERAAEPGLVALKAGAWIVTASH